MSPADSGQPHRYAASETALALEAAFQAAGMDPRIPGFYGHRESPPDVAMLQDYARWVLARPRDAAYDKRVREVVPQLCQIIVSAFKADNWQGGCVEASHMMVRMLERMGIWGFAVLGSTTLRVEINDLACGFYRHDFQDFPHAVLGHSWVVVPPFVIVDPTVDVQNIGDDPIREFLPSYVASEEAVAFEPDVSDVVSWRLRHDYNVREGDSDTELHHRLQPDLKTFGQWFPARDFKYEPLEIRYVPLDIHMPEVSLEDINRGGTIGRNGEDIWAEVVKVIGKD